MEVSQDKMKNNLWYQKNYTNDRNPINNTLRRRAIPAIN